MKYTIHQYVNSYFLFFSDVVRNPIFDGGGVRKTHRLLGILNKLNLIGAPQ